MWGRVLGGVALAIDESLEKAVFTKGPFDRIYEKESLPFMVISEPLIGSENFNEKSWKEMCQMMETLYGEAGGDLFVLGGLVAEGTDVKDAQKYIDAVPENVNVHVMYNAVDLENIELLYDNSLEKTAEEAKDALKNKELPAYISEFVTENDKNYLKRMSRKSKMPKEIVKTLKERAENEYFTNLEDLGENVKVYGSGEHKIELQRNGEHASLLIGSNVLNSKKRNKSTGGLTRRVHEKGLMEEKVEVDYVIDGYSMDFRFKPISPQKGTTPLYEVSVGPFNKSDVPGFSSGAVLLDHGKTTRVTVFNAKNMKIEDDTLNAMHISDTHDGKGNMRLDLARGVAYVMDKDESIELVINTGDDLQSINYPGASTEGIKRARIDDQFIAFWSRYLPPFMEVKERSRLKNPVLLVKGNHEKPLDIYGVNLTKIASFMLSAMEMLKEGKKDEVAGLPTDYFLEEEGEDCETYNFPFRSFAVGHEGYGEHEILTKDGESYGKILLAHKFDAVGEKRDPTSRTKNWLHETGRGNGMRMVLHGHSHIPMSSNVFEGIDLTVGASMEAKNRTKKHSWKTDSSYGIKTGFMEPVPGAWKKYIPKEGAITSEFLSETYLSEVYEARVKKKVEKNLERVPLDSRDSVF